MINIPAGEFELSIPVNNSIKIIHLKKKFNFRKSFKMGKYEVSNNLWKECYKEKFCKRKAILKDGEADNHPIVRINWHDAYQFTQWFSKKTNKKYRLPTEEEWAYAMNMGKDYKEEEFNYEYAYLNIKKIPIKRTRPIGSINKNEWGIHDFKGNVWEWTLTCWYGSSENILKNYTIQELNSPKACVTRIAQGENRSHIPDFISTTFNGGCSALRPAANLGFRMVSDE